MRTVLLAATLSLLAGHALSQELEQLVAEALPAVVSIRTQTPDGTSSGSGFIVDASGVVVTNLHVIRGASAVSIRLHNGEVFSQIGIGGYDDIRDIALLKFAGFNLPVLPLGNSDEVVVGETVFAVGTPLGLEHTVTTGIVSSVRLREDGTKVIQTDTAASPGSSGGPLLDDAGNVIGIVTFKITDGENLNFAIPINYARGLLGFQNVISLAELAENLGGTSNLFAATEPTSSITGDWRSLQSGNVTSLRESGEYIYGTRDTSEDEYLHNQSYQLDRQEDGSYEGIYIRAFTCNILTFGGSTQKYCAVETAIEFSSVTEARIEGRIETSGYPDSRRDQNRYCETCAESERENRVWTDFVWIPAD